MPPSSENPHLPSGVRSTDDHRAPTLVLAWMMFLIPALGATNVLLLQDTLKSAIFALGVLSATLIFFWQQRKRSSPLVWHPMLWFPVVLMLYALGSMVWSHTYLAGVEAVRWFLLGLLMWLTLNTLTSLNTRRLLWGIHCGASVASAWVVLQFLFDLQLFPQSAAPASTFINRNFFAEYAVSVVPLSFWLLMLQRKPLWAWILAASTGANLAAINMTATRSALLALLLITPLLGFAFWRLRKLMPFMQLSPSTQRGAWALLGTVLLGLCALPSHSPLIGTGNAAWERVGVRAKETLRAQEYREGSASVRMEMWIAGARMLKAHWPSGVGAGAWEAEIPRYQEIRGSAEIDPYAHNEYLQMLCEYGLIVGGMVLAFFLVWLVQSLAWAWAGSTAAEQRMGPMGQSMFALASVCALAIVALAGFPLHLAPCTALLGIALTITGCPTSASTPFYLSHRAKIFCILGFGMALVVSLMVSCAAAYTERMYGLATVELIEAVKGPGEKAEKIASATRHLARAQEVQPNYPKLLIPIATELVELGEWQTARHAMEALALARPQVADYWFSLAVLCTKLGEFSASEKALDRLEDLQPNGVRNMKARIDLLMHMQQYTQAKAVLQQYLAKWPSNEAVDPGLSILEQKLGAY